MARRPQIAAVDFCDQPLGLFGGGGSILAVPLLVHLVGVANPHEAIGTSAIAVSANALAGVATHFRLGTIRWQCVAFFSGAGIVGAALGSQLAKTIDGQSLLFLFGILMFVVSGAILRRRNITGDPAATCTPSNALKVVSLGAATGFCSGFFGIGGGFLIVPGLVAATGMPLINAVSSSLVIISTFGLTTSASYLISNLVIWPMALAFIFGGTIGIAAGTRIAHMLIRRSRILNSA